MNTRISPNLTSLKGKEFLRPTPTSLHRCKQLLSLIALATRSRSRQYRKMARRLLTVTMVIGEKAREFQVIEGEVQKAINIIISDMLTQ